MKLCCVLLSGAVNLLLSELPVAVQGLPICLTGNITSIAPTVHVEMFGEIRKYDDRNWFKLTCFSCLMPHAEGVDFYVNNVMKDSIRYLDGLCYHKLGACIQERCTCAAEGKHFTWIFESYLSYLHFACVMRFNDIKPSIVIRKANWIYDKRDLRHSQETSISISNPDKMADINHILTGNDKDEGNNSGYIGCLVFGSLGLIILAVVAVFSWQICTLGNKKAMQGDYIICDSTSLDTSLFSIYSNTDCTCTTNSITDL